MDELREVPSPAKLNLFLHVLGRRADGYHDLQSVFTFIDLEDRLDFRLLPSGLIRRVSTLSGVPEDQDLVVRAARCLQEAAGVWQGVEISVRKVIPQGSGLGGGSSNAATTLLALNRLWGLGWERPRLAQLGLTLGADVPVFIGGRSAFAEGVGERLMALELEPCWYLVVYPEVAIATRAIFAAPELTRNTLPVKMSDFVVGFGHNDLQPVAVRRYPQVATLLKRLQAWGDARMTGSGACCFVRFPAEEPAREAQRALISEFNQSFVVRGLSNHPLYDWM